MARSERLYAVLADAGADVKMHTYDGADHFWLGAPTPPRMHSTRTFTFLRR